ncbi:hypothetical protein DL98DRAFT_440977, partial [Cadophora sp. DSE1049]
VNQTGFKNNAFALTILTVWDGKKKVLRFQRKPKETATHARTSRVPFRDQPTKKLWIPQLYDAYNHNIKAVDLGDQLHAYNNSERRLRRGPIQRLIQFILLVILSNCYLIYYHFNYDKKRSVSLRSQNDFRIQLIEALIAIKKDTPDTRKRRNSRISKDKFEVPAHRHKLIKMSTRSNCATCKRGRIWDRPRKRVAIEEIALNSGRTSRRSCTSYSCKQCQLHFCNNRECFHIYYNK